jgi:peptide/nickel transport system substrate-binding protein
LKANRGALALALLLVVALVAAGCGSSKSSSTSTSGGGGANAVPAQDINPQPRDNLKQGGQVVWVSDQYSTQWNYNQVNGPESSTTYILNGILPYNLFNADEHANLSVNKDYLVSAELTNKNPQTVTYKIQPKAKWSDGKPIDAADFIAQWKALNGKNPKFQPASTTGYDQIASVKQGSDPKTVIVTFAKPFSEWQSLFSPLYPASTNDTPDHFNKGWLNKIPVTAGPFKFGSFNPTQKTVTIVRDPNWWGPPAKLDRIITRTLEQDAAVSAFVNGEVDLVDIGADPANYKRALTARKGVVRLAGGPDFRHFTFNGTSPMLKDLKVRQAVAMGINRQAIAKSDLTGLGNYPTTTMDNHIFVPTQVGYQDNSDGIGKYNPDKAKQMLDADGWKMGAGGYRQKGGKTLVLRFIIPAGVPASKREGELAQSMLKDIGVKLNVVTVPSDPFFDKYVIPGNYDITPFSWIGTPFPVSPNRSIYAKPVGNNIQQNFARVGSTQIDDLMNKAISTLDPAQSHKFANQADALIWQEVHSLILFQRPQIWGTTKGLANVGSYGLGTLNYEDIGFQK